MQHGRDECRPLNCDGSQLAGGNDSEHANGERLVPRLTGPYAVWRVSRAARKLAMSLPIASLAMRRTTVLVSRLLCDPT